jgi:hypothetical protein
MLIIGINSPNIQILNNAIDNFLVFLIPHLFPNPHVTQTQHHQTSPFATTACSAPKPFSISSEVPPFEFPSGRYKSVPSHEAFCASEPPCTVVWWT